MTVHRGSWHTQGGSWAGVAPVPALLFLAVRVKMIHLCETRHNATLISRCLLSESLWIRIENCLDEVGWSEPFLTIAPRAMPMRKVLLPAFGALTSRSPLSIQPLAIERRIPPVLLRFRLHRRPIVP